MTGRDLQRDLEIVRLAAAHYRYEGNRVEAARDRFALSQTAFWQTVARLLDDPEVAAAEPGRVARLRRVRDARLRLKRPA
jgi:hypothetical protein